MASYFGSETCLTCYKKPANFHKISSSDLNLRLNICGIICQHFWFKEDDLQSAIVCETCWEKVNHFHLFYLDVKKLHEHREMAPLSMFIKQEELTIEETQLQENCIDISTKNQNLFDKADCKLEIKEECDAQLKTKEPAEVNPHPRKKIKYTRQLPHKRIAKWKPLTPEEQQAEDNFIKQHTRYICDECNIEFKNFLSIKTHRMKMHKNETFVCCGTQYRTRAKLYQHVQSILNPEAFRHKKVNHTAKKELVFQCYLCPKSFIKEWMLKSHFAEHDALKNETAKCELCGKCFQSKKILNNHVKSAHKEPTDFICKICSKGYYRRSMFLAHQKTHDLTVERPRKKCPICNKWFANQCSWRKHMRRHDEGEYKCEMCGYMSINVLALQTHMTRKHGSNNKPYVCEQCGNEYTRASSLKEHTARAHTREHLYQCQYCEKKFFSSANMYSHRKKDHPQEWLEDHVSKYASNDEGSSVGSIDGKAVS